MAVEPPPTSSYNISGGGSRIQAIDDRTVNAGKYLHGLEVQEDSYIKKIDEPFDLVIASFYYDVIWNRLQGEEKLDNPHMREVYAVNAYKVEPPYGPNTVIEDKQWEWLHAHFKGEYSQKVIELIRKNRGNPKAENYYRIKDVWDYAGSTAYWTTVKGKNYFDKAVVLDCGAYIGDSINALVKAAGLPVERYYAFEPMAENYQRLAALHPAGVKHFYPIQKGIGSKNETIEATYNEAMPDWSSLCQKVSSAPVQKVEITSLDSLGLQDLSDTDFYIKMDIEGSELAALHGAERLIREKRPNLAICLYHWASDIYKIPQYIDSLDLGYEFYLAGGCHTIMIAVPTR